MQANEAQMDNWHESANKLYGELLVLISGIAITIRMFSAYNQSAVSTQESQVALMWLSDSIHNLHVLGRALQSGDVNEIKRAAQYQKEYWQGQECDVRRSSCFNMPAGNAVFDIADGIDLMERISSIE
jgi:hypothetical protein